MDMKIGSTTRVLQKDQSKNADVALKFQGIQMDSCLRKAKCFQNQEVMTMMRGH